MSRVARSLLAVFTSSLAIGLVVSNGRPVSAQQPTLDFPLRMNAEQAESLRRVWNGELSYIPGELLVKFRDGSEPTGQRRALSVLRAGPSQRTEQWIGDVLLVRSQLDEDSVAAAALVARQPEVQWVQPNYFRRFASTPNDPDYSRQWNFDAIKMPQAWDINPGSSSSITVAVVDSGITTTAETFVFPLWTGSRIESVPVPVGINPDIPAARILAGYDFAFWFGPVIDFDGHGTHVSGTVLEETNNSLGPAGIAYRARLLPVKACVGYWDIQITMSALGQPGFVDPRQGGGCFDSAVAQAIRYAVDSGAQIINLSIGGPQPSAIEQEALAYAARQGAFVAIAAGNEFEDGNPTSYPAAFAPMLEGVVAVGAVGRSNRRAFYSNSGPYVEVAAPGGDERDGGLTGVIFQTTLFPPDYDPFTVIRPRFDRYAVVPEQGTSMAAPHVAGVAALLHSQGINRGSAIEAALKRFAVDLGPTGRDNEFGFGLIDARATLRGLGVAR
jgi:serine protease